MSTAYLTCTGTESTELRAQARPQVHRPARVRRVRARPSTAGRSGPCPCQLARRVARAVRAAAGRRRVRARSTTSTPRPTAIDERTAAVIVEPDPGRGRHPGALRRLPAGLRRLAPRRPARCSSSTRSRAAWAAPGAGSPTSTGASSPTSSRWPRRWAAACRSAPSLSSARDLRHLRRPAAVAPDDAGRQPGRVRGGHRGVRHHRARRSGGEVGRARRVPARAARVRADAVPRAAHRHPRPRPVVRVRAVGARAVGRGRHAGARCARRLGARTPRAPCA